jgi:hypothetical protein
LWTAIRSGVARTAAALPAVGNALGTARRFSAKSAASINGKAQGFRSAVAYWYGGVRGKIWLLRLRMRMQARQTEKGLPGLVASTVVRSPWVYIIAASAGVVLVWAGTSLLQSGPADQPGAATRPPESAVEAPAQTAAGGLEQDAGRAEEPETPTDAQPQPQVAPPSEEPSQLAQQPAAQEAPPPVTTTPDRSEEVTPTPGPQAEEDAAAPVEPARLVVNSRPWGRVFIDGELIGNTPQLNLQVPPGVHMIRVVQDGYAPFEQELQLAAGQVVRITDIVLEEEQ